MQISRATVIKSFFWKFFERIGFQLMNFVVTIVLARLLLPEQYAAISLIMIFINICNVIIDGGLNTALVQKKDSDDVDFSTIFYISLVVAALLYLLLYFTAPGIAAFYDMPYLVPVIRVLGVNLFFYVFNSIQRAYVSKHMLFDKLFYGSISAVIVSGAIGIYLAYRGWGIWALVGQNLVSQVVGCLVLWFAIKWRPVLKFSVDRLKVLFDYGWKILGTNLITVLFVEIRKMCIGKLYTPSSLAYYEKGEHFPNLVMSNIFASVQSVMFPTFSKSQDDAASVKNIMRRSTKMLCFVIYPLMVGMIFAAEPIVRILLTEKWMPVADFIKIMSIANFFRPISIINWEAIKALGHSGITFKLEIVKKIIDVIILLVSISYGVYAIAWGMVLYNFICIFINLAPNVRLLGYRIREQLLDVMPSLLISLGMGVAIFGLKYVIEDDLLLILSQFFVGAVVYLFLSGIFKEESFMYLLDMVRKRKRGKIK